MKVVLVRTPYSGEERGAHLRQSQGTQKRSLPVSSATRNVTFGVPSATTA